MRSPEDAEEAVQDAFIKMYLYADKYHAQEGASFSSWMYTILNRVAYTKYAAQKKAWEKTASLEPEHYESLPDARAEFLETLPFEMKSSVRSLRFLKPQLGYSGCSLLKGRLKKRLPKRNNSLSLP